MVHDVEAHIGRRQGLRFPQQRRVERVTAQASGDSRQNYLFGHRFSLPPRAAAPAIGLPSP